MGRIKQLAKQTAFTLIELIVTLLILSIVAIYAQSKFSSSNSYQQNSVVAQLISSARLAQQLSMNDSARTFALIIQNNQIDLTIDGSSLSIGSMQFPIIINDAISLSPISSINFDLLGGTNSLIINVTAGATQRVCFESNGYIHSC